jgi:tetratricopeptide (TPR) repeat protein
VLAAINSCGYDQDLGISDPTRAAVRGEIRRNIQGSDDAQAATAAVCDYYQAHRANDASHDLAQYVSLALYIQGPPHFLPRVKEELMPPDAVLLSAFSALLEKFYEKANLHSIWERHRNNYAAAMERYHAPLAKMVFDNEIYLKLQSGGYLGRPFTIYLDFLGDPNEINARNYGSDYYVVVFPSPEGGSDSPLKMEQIRHTFLHYLLDPLADKHFTAVKRLEPLLSSLRRAPLDDSFKGDISLLVTECLVRAIEIRTSGDKKTAEALRTQAVDDAVKQGYILTRYFYETLVVFEKDPAGIRSSYSDFLNNIDLKKEAKAASEVQFASASTPELLQLSRLQDRQMLIAAEKRLAAGDTKGAQELAQLALTRKVGDQGRALFILAEAAVANKDITGARENFQKAIQEAKDPKVVGWSHVYLGRILDMKEDRDGAVSEYRAALASSGTLPEIKAAAEHGLQQAYEPPAKTQTQ